MANKVRLRKKHYSKKIIAILIGCKFKLYAYLIFMIVDERLDLNGKAVKSMVDGKTVPNFQYIVLKDKENSVLNVKS